MNLIFFVTITIINTLLILFIFRKFGKNILDKEEKFVLYFSSLFFSMIVSFGELFLKLVINDIC
jgi:hypothetical protein